MARETMKIRREERHKCTQFIYCLSFAFTNKTIRIRAHLRLVLFVYFTTITQTPNTFSAILKWLICFEFCFFCHRYLSIVSSLFWFHRTTKKQNFEWLCRIRNNFVYLFMFFLHVLFDCHNHWQIRGWMHRFFSSLWFVHGLCLIWIVTKRRHESTKRTDTDKLFDMFVPAERKNNAWNMRWYSVFVLVAVPDSFPSKMFRPNISIGLIEYSVCDWFSVMTIFIYRNRKCAHKMPIIVSVLHFNQFYEVCNLNWRQFPNRHFTFLFSLFSCIKRNWKEKLNCSIFWRHLQFLDSDCAYIEQ